MHTQHEVVTIALQSRQCKKEFGDFKNYFEEQKQQWYRHFKEMENTKTKLQREQEKIKKDIDKAFDKIIKRLEDQKKQIQDEYSQRFIGFTMGFDTMFNGYYQSLKDIGKMESQMKEYQTIYSRSDFDVVREYYIRKDQVVFENFVSAFDLQFEQYINSFDNLKRGTLQTYKFSATVKDQLLQDLIKQTISIQISDIDLNLMASPDSQSSYNSSNSKMTPSPKKDNYSNYESTSNYHQHNNVINEQNEESKIYDESTTLLKSGNYRIKISPRKINKGIKGQAINQNKILAEHDFYHVIDRSENKLRIFSQDKLEVQNLSSQFQSVKDMRSIKINNQIFLFDSTETVFSKYIFAFNDESKTFDKLDSDYDNKRKKISACAFQNKYIYFTGEFENHKVDRGAIERFDVVEGKFEEIYGLNISQTSYILCIVNERYLYAFPVSINMYKVQVLDLYQLDQIDQMTQRKFYQHPQKSSAFVPKWQKTVNKLPVSFKVFLSSKSQAIQMNFEEILILGNKTSYIFNFKKEEFTHYINTVVEDEFLDGLYRTELNQNQILAYGNNGLHIFDYLSRKWSLYDEISIRKQNQE